jgi:23S rRNA pseudouridine1911/1915/1917 synthase
VIGSGGGLPDGLPDRPVLLRREAGADEDQRRLDQVLAGWLSEPRARTQARIAEGEVAVGRAVAAKSRTLRAGDVVTVVEAEEFPAFAAADLPDVPVRYEDEHLLVLAKPPGLMVHPGAGRRSEIRATLVDVLQARGVPLAAASGDPERPGIVHRLDRDTSGVLAVAKSDAAHEGLTELFRRHDVRREYWTIVDGVPEPPHATIDAAIARSASQRTRFRVDAQGRRAVSHYDVLEDHGRAAVVRVRLETGRTHQVRVHLSAVGHPVAGDRAYGASMPLAEELGLVRLALHARRLAFRHPVTGADIDVEEPLPGDLTAALARLRA